MTPPLLTAKEVARPSPTPAERAFAEAAARWILAAARERAAEQAEQAPADRAA